MAHFSGSKPGEACQDILYLSKVACTITLAYRYVGRPFAGAHGTVFSKVLKLTFSLGLLIHLSYPDIAHFLL